MAIAATYISANSFTVVGDRADEFNNGRRVRATCSGSYDYCNVLSASYSSPNTTIILTDDSDDLNSGLTAVYYGVSADSSGSIPTHSHDNESEGGEITLLTLPDTPDVYDDDKYLRSTTSGTEWVSAVGGVSAHSELSELDYVSAGHTGFSPTSHSHTESDISDLDKYTEAEVDTISGSLNTKIEDKPDTLIELDDTPAAYDTGKYLKSTTDGTEWATVSGGTGTSAHSELTELDYASAGHTGFSPTIHSHTESDISDLDKYTQSEVDTISGSLNTKISEKADTIHTHDDRYYTESEIDTWRNDTTQTEMGYLHGVTSDVQNQLDNKSATSHLHDGRYYTETELDAGQLDNRYYTESEVDSALANKSDTSHLHDDRYYTESEVDTISGSLQDGIDTHGHVSTEITMSKINTPTYETLQDWLNNTQSSGRMSGGNTTPHIDAVTGVTVSGAGYGEFKVSGDQTTGYIVSETIHITGSTNNNGYFTVASGVAYSGGTTTIPVEEAVGVVADGNITNGTVDVAEGTAFIKQTDSDIGETVSFNIHATTNVALTDITTNYVYVDYNAGTPDIKVTTDEGSIEKSMQFPLSMVYKNNGRVWVCACGIYLPNRTRLDHDRILALRGYERASGGEISEYGTRNIQSTVGEFYRGTTQIDTIAKTSVDDKLTTVYYDGAEWVWTEDLTQVDNTYYNNIATGLVELTTSRYAVNWVCIDYLSNLYVVYGRGDYTLPQAQLAGVPNLMPVVAYEFGIIAAKIIIQKGSSSIAELVSAYTQVIPSETPTVHNDLSGLNDNDYKHLTATEKTKFDGIDANADVTADNPPQAHTHDDRYYTESETDTISGSLNTKIEAKPDTLLELSDTPVAYDDNKYLKSTVDGTEWATVSGGTGTSDHSELTALDYASAGHTGFAGSDDLATTSGTLQTAIDGKSATGHTHDDRYYTESEVDTISGTLSSEIDSNIATHTSNADAHHAESHTVASHSDTSATGAQLNALVGGEDTSLHKHGDQYYTETETDTWRNSTTQTEMGYVNGVTSDIQTQLNSKSDTSHTHDDRYYTESEIDTISGSLNTKIDGKDNYTSWSFAVDGETKDAITSGDTLDFVGGDNITITRSADDQITISGTTGGGGLSNIVEDTTPQLGGQLEVGEQDIKLDSSLSADEKYSGKTSDGVLGDTLAFGGLVYLNTTDQRWEKTDADAEATSGDVELAIVLAAGNDGDTRLLLKEGYVKDTSWTFTSYGQALFISVTAGTMTQTAPSDVGDIVRVVGKASTAQDQIYFKPSQTWLEVSSTGHEHTLLSLTDTPAAYDDNKYLKSTTDGTEWATVSGGTGVTDHSELSNLDYASAGHTGFSPDTHTHDDRYYTESEVDTISGSLQTNIDGKSDTGHTHTEANITDLDKYTQAEVDAKWTTWSGTIDHDTITNNHNLTTDIDHDQLTNFSVDEHRVINDSAGDGATTELWSADKIFDELATKSDTGHSHTESDISDLDKYTQSEVDTISGSLSSEIDTDIATHTSNIDAHHNESHTVVSHSDTTATGANLNELVGSGDTTLHKHDGQYYTEGEVDTISGSLNTDINSHASNHTDGTDDIQNATDTQKGLATSTQITKLDGIDAGADVTADNPPQAHDLDSHNSCTLAELSADITDATLIDTADARLSDARTPTAHETSHESGGGDELDFDQLADGTTYKKFLATERTKLTGIDTGADVTADNPPQAHNHDGSYYTEAEVDTISGSLNTKINAKPDTLLELTDTPAAYDENKYLKSTTDGTEWATVSGGEGTDHSTLSNLDYASAGHTGFASSDDLTTTSGVLQTAIEGKPDTLLELSDTPAAYDNDKYLKSTTDGTEWATVSGGEGTSDHSELSNLDYASAGHTGFATIGNIASLNTKGASYWCNGNDAYLYCANDNDLNITDKITLSASIRADETDRLSSIISKGVYSLKTGCDNKPYMEVIMEAPTHSYATSNVGDLTGQSESLCSFGGKLYCGSSGGYIYRYDGGTTWTSVGQAGSSYIQALVVYDNKLYCGSYDTYVYRYDGGTTWTSVGTVGREVESLVVYNNKIYAGNSTFLGGRVHRYDGGTSWTSVGNTSTKYPCLIVFDSKLYVGTYGGYVQRYDGGTTWAVVGSPYDGGGNHGLRGLAVYNNNLYRGNTGGGSASYGHVYRYNGGTSWTDCGKIGEYTEETLSLVVYNGKLFACGEVESGQEPPTLYYYNGGTSWTSVGTVVDVTPYNLTVYDGKLYYTNHTEGKIWVYGEGYTAYSDTAITTSPVNIIGTYDESTVKIYIDGEETGSTAASGILETESYDLLIGGSIGSSSRGTGEEYFKGDISNVRIYNTATTENVGESIPYKYIGASETSITSGALTIGKEYTIASFGTGDDFLFVGASTNTSGISFTAVNTTPTTWTNGSTLKRTGCVLQLDQEGIGTNQWTDSSGNSMDATVSGTIAINI